MKYVEVHRFADDRFVSGGFTHFLWSTEDSQPALPTFPDQFGIAVEIAEDADFPAIYATYNTDTATWGDPIADNAVPELAPFWSAVWDNSSATWSIATI